MSIPTGLLPIEIRTNMLLKKSPGGSIFPYYYKGGELFGLHLGSFGANEDGVIARIKAEEFFFLQQNRCIGVWIDFYQTKLTNRVIEEFIEMVIHCSKLISKLGLVGCSRFNRYKINQVIKKAESLSSLPVKYFDDPEDAKTWLVSELG
jgi:hypothetical protein